MEYTNADATRLAFRFSRVLHEWNGAEAMRRVAEKNALRAPDAGHCHSHDVCDANMAMDEAMRTERFLAPADLAETSGEYVPDESAYGVAVALWNRAWERAGADGFRVGSDSRVGQAHMLFTMAEALRTAFEAEQGEYIIRQIGLGLSKSARAAGFRRTDHTAELALMGESTVDAIEAAIEADLTGFYVRAEVARGSDS